MITRWIADSLEELLTHFSSVALLGSRQVGKTTLSRSLLKSENTIYLDLESQRDLVKLTDAEAFFSLHQDKLIILDEIQRKPELFQIIRGVIDRNREAGRRNGQFLFLGSASMDLLRQSSESLAGRISYLEMGGLHELEAGTENRQKLILRGGFPDSYLSPTDALAMEWLRNLIKTYLEREIPQFGFNIPAPRLRRLWGMLAHLQGETLNYSELAGNLEVSRPTITHYLDLLTDLLLVRRLEPWHTNVKKRLIKSPRYYIRDSGILHALLGVNSYDDLLSHPVLGKSWEGYVIESIHAVLPKGAETYFYRTAAGAEVDLIIKMPNHTLWAIEIKYGSAPKVSKHYHRTCDELGVTKRVLIYSGEETFPVNHGIWIYALPTFLKELTES